MPLKQHITRFIIIHTAFSHSLGTGRQHPVYSSVITPITPSYTHYTHYTNYTPFFKVFLNLAFRGYFPKTAKKGVMV